jgi:hypothetical protein
LRGLQVSAQYPYGSDLPASASALLL